MTELTAADLVSLRAAEHGLDRPGATADELARFDRLYPVPPAGLREVLVAVDGEWFPGGLVPHCRLAGVAEILTNRDDLGLMVREDETLPEYFLHFVPFLHTDVKSDVGVFTADSPVLPNRIVEVHYESGEAIVWDDSLHRFFARLMAPPPGDAIAALGREFPVPGQTPVSLFDLG